MLRLFNTNQKIFQKKLELILNSKKTKTKN